MKLEKWLVMQVKLLRVLEEREIERIGTNKNIPLDGKGYCYNQ